MMLCSHPSFDNSAAISGSPDRVASIMQGLLIDSGWEVQDSMLELIVVMIKKAEGK